jgi:Arc/MetJ family transcription regulator
MRSNIVLDEALIHEAFELTGLKSKRELINYALLELVRLKKKSLKKSLCDAFTELHKLELANDPFPEIKRENRPNPLADQL